jgi:transcriptional regulator with XRE-family HTH domain
MKIDNLRNNIKLMREQLKISQFSFALALGNRKEDYYGRIERGEKEIYLFDTIIIAHHLGISPILLLYFSDFKVFTPLPAIFAFNSLNKHGIETTTNHTSKHFEKIFDEIRWKACTGKKSCNEKLFYLIVHATIRHLRMYNNLNTAHLSDGLQFSKRHYAKIERDAKPLTLTQCFTLCECMNISITKLMLVAGIYFWFTDKKGEMKTQSNCLQMFPHLFN